MSNPARPTTAAIGGMIRNAAPSAEEMSQITNEMRQIQDQGTHRIRDGDQYYPQVTYPRDPRDEDFRIREAILEERSKRGYQHIIDQNDVEYWKSKQAIQEGALFKQWCTTKFDLEDPANQRLFEQIMPSYITDQEEFLKQRFELALRKCLIDIRGIRDVEDLKFMWAVETGRISIPAGFDAKTIGVAHPEPFGRKVKPAYKAGLFNPLRYVDSEINPAASGFNEDNRYNVNGAKLGGLGAETAYGTGNELYKTASKSPFKKTGDGVTAFWPGA